MEGSENTSESQPVARARGNAPASLRSEGQRALSLVPGTLTAIAAAVGVDKGTISRWRSGEKSPGGIARAKIHALYAIEPSAWDRAPYGAARPDSASKSEATAPRANAATVLETCERQLERLHDLISDSGLVASERLKAEQLINAAIKTKEGIEARAELLEARIVREHPRWVAIRTGLVEVLREHPAAAEAVARWLEELEVDS